MRAFYTLFFLCLFYVSGKALDQHEIDCAEESKIDKGGLDSIFADRLLDIEHEGHVKFLKCLSQKIGACDNGVLNLEKMKEVFTTRIVPILKIDVEAKKDKVKEFIQKCNEATSETNCGKVIVRFHNCMMQI